MSKVKVRIEENEIYPVYTVDRDGRPNKEIPFEDLELLEKAESIFNLGQRYLASFVNNTEDLEKIRKDLKDAIRGLEQC